MLEYGLFVQAVDWRTALRIRLQSMSASFETKNSEIISRLLEQKTIYSVNLALIWEQQ